MSPLHATPTNPALLRQAFGCFPSGVTAVCALDSGAPVGMAASTFTPVSLSPALISVCVQDTSTTWPKLRRRSHVGVSVLAQGQDEICRSLAGKGATGSRESTGTPTRAAVCTSAAPASG